MSGVEGACPQCGAPIHFGGGHSIATVCTYCRAAVVRRGVKPELVGTVPDLVSTQTGLSLGDAGKVDKRGFRIVGRLQLDQGAAAWDEWYLTFDDGTDGWLAEASGKLFATRRQAARGLPRFEALQPGAAVTIASFPVLRVDELGEARFTSAAGELPFAPRLTSSYRFADLSGPNGEFCTIDYGEPGDEPLLFAGRRSTYGEVGLSAAYAAHKASGKGSVAGPEGSALACVNCGAPLSLKLQASQTAACPSCHSLLDLSSGALSIIGKLAKRGTPSIPLGSKGSWEGAEYEVLGYLRRSTTFDDVKYSWHEWQLCGPEGYRWLTEYNGHWLWLVPIEAGQVEGTPRDETYVISDGVHYLHYQTAEARYEDIQGELSWKVKLDGTITVFDFVAPPRALSYEKDKHEVSWSRGQAIDGKQLWQAFKLAGSPPKPIGIGSAEENTWRPAQRAAIRASVAGFFVLIVTAIALAATLARQPVVQLDVPLVNESVALSDEFDLPQASQSIELDASADLVNAWVGLDLALVESNTGEIRAVEAELSHFEGIDEGERWAEGSRGARIILGNVARGRYLLRAEVSLDKSSHAALPEHAHLAISRGVFVWAPFLLALVALLIGPFITTLLASSFERRRWSESDHVSGGSEEKEVEAAD